jgi:hypothetical protein
MDRGTDRLGYRVVGEGNWHTGYELPPLRTRAGQRSFSMLCAADYLHSTSMSGSHDCRYGTGISNVLGWEVGSESLSSSRIADVE